MEPLLDVRRLNIAFPAPRQAQAGASENSERPGSAAGVLRAVRDLSFYLGQGEVLGLVGESGSGKSLTSLAAMRLLPDTARVSGEIHLRNDHGSRDVLHLADDEMRSVRGETMAMIFQEPMTALNPVMRVGEQIAEAVRAHHAVSRAEAWQRAVDGMNEVAIPDAGRRARDYPHQLSGGMRQRIMIAMAIVNRPKLLIADEPTTALDVTIQAQILDLLRELRAKFSLAMLFISHDLAVVSGIADRVAVMYAGNLVELGARRDLFTSPAHPYTRGLLEAVPTLTTDRSKTLRTIEGTVPSLQAPLPGCPFEPRCSFRVPSCSEALPPLTEVAPGHWARCPVLNPGASAPGV